jgi:8-oxo-dGTP pyrophosphatase MutT (NUDIX family)
MERWRPGKHYFSVPGGGIEPGETAEQTVVRELREETGCVVRPERPLYLVRFEDGTEHSIFLATYVSGTPHLPVDSPEAQLDDPNNRFQPNWVPLAALAATPFLVWEVIKQQLLHDLEHGFSDSLQLLASKP